jgi:cytochrome P450
MGSLPVASRGDTLRFLAEVVAPTVAKGPIIRRRAVLGLVERLHLDKRAVRRMQRLRGEYGQGPLLLRTPGQPRAVILAAEHVARVLDEGPEPFSPASSEKRAALAHFEPRGVLISRGTERAERRRYNEAILESDQERHHLAGRFSQVTNEELATVLEASGARQLGWNDFSPAWFRIVRRVVLGDGARDDVRLTEQLARLRRDANWAMLRPRRHWLRASFFRRLRAHLVRGEPGSLAGVMAATRATGLTAPDQQVPQWLFALDAVGMTTFRALALLATHPEQAARAREEPIGSSPYIRATILESLRLWPTTPLVLRESTRETEWDAGTMPAGTGLTIYAPYFHRDDRHLPYADRLEVGLWTGERDAVWPLIPFSRGPAICPGRHLALFLSCTVLAALLRRWPIRLLSGSRLGPERPLPTTLNHFTLRFELGRG